MSGGTARSLGRTFGAWPPPTHSYVLAMHSSAESFHCNLLLLHKPKKNLSHLYTLIYDDSLAI